MTWFRVDDKFHGHPKVKGLKAVDPLGLWLLCGSYCSDHPKLDGRIPLNVAADFCGSEVKAKSFAAKLVTRGLWEVEPSDGWRFHDWHDYQPSAEEVDERKAALSAKRAEAGRRGAAKRWQSSEVPPFANGKRMANDAGNEDSSLASDSPDPVPIPSRSDQIPLASPESSEPEQPKAVTESQATPAKRRVPDPDGESWVAGRWAEGVRQGSGAPVAAPTRSEVVKLLGVEDALGRKPTLNERCAFLHQLGVEFGKENVGKTLSVWTFADWTTRRVKPKPTPPPLPRPTRPEDRPASPEVAKSMGELLARAASSIGKGPSVRSVSPSPLPIAEDDVEVPRAG